MHCLVGCLALCAPRVALGLVWIFGTIVQQAFHGRLLWPLLGLLFMPLTTLAYSWAHVRTGGSISGLHLGLVVLAALIDFGLVGSSRRRRREKDEGKK